MNSPAPVFERKQHTLRDGTQISYLVGGPEGAETVVLLHGGGTDHALLSWGETLLVLRASGYRVLAPDLPGYGESPPAGWPSTRPNLSRAVAEWVGDLKLRPAVLVGISMGGSLALAQALNDPASARALVLVGSYGLAKWSPYHRLAVNLARLPQGTNSANRWLARSPLLVRLLLLSFIYNRAAITPELVREVQQALTNPNNARAFAEFQRHEIQPAGLCTNFQSRLHELRLPVLIVHGSRDVGVPVQAAREATAKVAGAELKVFEGAGHWTQRDQAARFHHELLKFLGKLT